MINFTTATNGKTTKTFKNPTSTRSRLNILKFLSAFALVMLGVNGVMGQVTIASQNFESTPATPTMTISTTNIGTPAVATFSSSTSGASDAPASSNLFAAGSRGYRISGPSTGNTTTGQTLTFSAVNTSGHSSVQVSYRIAGMSIGSGSNGMDASTDQVLLEVSPDGGTTWYQQSVLNMTGVGSNARWAFSATGTGTRAYAANNTFTTHSITNTASGATLTGANAITTVTVTGLPSVSNLQVRISAQCNSTNESWIIDDVIITGTAATPSIAISNGTIAAGNVNNGQTNVILQRYDLAVTTSNATLNGLTVTTAGTYTAADLTNLKVRYSTDATLDGGDATLSTLSSPAVAGSQVFPSFTSQLINSLTTGYIFVTADIASGASNGNTININTTAFSNISFAAGTKTGTDPVAAGGVQTIVVATPDIALSSPAASSANITVGTTNNVIYRFDLAITTATPSLTGVTINTSTGSNVSGDLTNLKCWYQTSTTFNAGTATLLSTKTTSLAAGSQVFPTFSSQSLTTGSTYYIFITADVPLTATPNNTIIVSAITTSDLTFATGNKTGTANASGTKTIIDCTPADVTSAAASSASSSSVLTWANPACYDEILIVAALASNTGTPTGNGSAYTGNLAYGSGTALGNGFVVYKGSTSSQTVTGLTNGTQYFFKYFTRRGTTWTSGTEVDATPNVAGYYWNGASIAANPATGGTGIWGTANSWRQPSATGAQATWADNNNAIFAGTAGTVTLDATRIATGFYFNTSGYVLANSTTQTLTGPIVLGNNVGLTFSPNVNIVTPAGGTVNIGSVSGSGTANITINSAQGSAINVAQRINLATASSSISVPINIVSAGGTGTGTVAGIVATATGTSLSSTAAITNNTAIKTVIGATSGDDLTANGVISGSADLMFAAGASGGAGTVTLNAANTYTGATIFNAANSGVIRLGITNALPTGTNVTMANSNSNGGIFDLNGFNQTIGSLTSGVGGGSIRNNGATDATLTISGSTSPPAAFGLVIADGTTNKTLLTRAGTGTLTISGANTYSGATTVSAGTLQLAVGNVGSVGSITSSPIGKSTLNLNGGTLSSNDNTARTVLNATSIGGNITLGDATNTGALTFDAATTISGATRTLTTASAITFAGAIGDGGSGFGITKAGAGTLTLSAANTYTGATTVSAGTLQLAGGNVGSVGAITSSPVGTSTLNLHAGTLSSNSTTARTVLNAISIGGNITLGDGTNTGAITFDAATTISGATRTLTTASAVTFAGAIGDGGSGYGITKAGAGTLSLTAANTYTGLTAISAGILQLNRTVGTTIPVTNNATISGGTLQISTNQTLNDVTLTSGTLIIDNGVTLTINGNFTGGGTIENNGTIVLVGPSSFPGSGTTISAMNNLAIDRASNVTLDQSITITGNLTLTNGKLITGACYSGTSNIALTMADNATITGASASRFVDGILKKTGDDAFTFPIGSGAKYAPVTLTAPSAITDRFAVCYTGSNPNSSYSITAKAGSLNNVSKMEYWHINREAGSSSANVTLSWDTLARSGPVRDMSQLRVCRWNGSQWDDLSSTGTTGSNASGTVTSGSVSSFSPFTLGSSGSANPLPVTWAYFTAQKTDGGNQLDWGTASEKNTSHFEIEYSIDGSHFIAMNDKINAAGNSAHLLEYRCIHKLSPPLIYYRIKQVDLDGLYDYSKTIILKNKDVTSKNFIKVLPSYVQGQEPLTIQGYESNMPFVFYEIINGQGQRILSDKISTIDGYFHHSLSLEMYPTGLYYLRVFNSDLDNLYQGKIRK